MPGAIQSEVPYSAFSGANMNVTVGPRRVGTLQGLTVSITREVAALYGFGDANPKAFVKGKRGIAGSLVFTQFDRHALLRDVFREAYNTPFADNGSLFNTQFAQLGAQQNVLAGQRIATRNFAHDVKNAAEGAFGSDTDQALLQEMEEVYNLVKQQRLRYSDQIPEFDVTVTMVNESGQAAVVVIGGIVLVNEGWGYTMDDLVSEVAFTFVARYVTPLTSLTDVTQAQNGRLGDFVNMSAFG